MPWPQGELPEGAREGGSPGAQPGGPARSRCLKPRPLLPARPLLGAGCCQESDMPLGTLPPCRPAPCLPWARCTPDVPTPGPDPASPYDTPQPSGPPGAAGLPGNEVQTRGPSCSRLPGVRAQPAGCPPTAEGCRGGGDPARERNGEAGRGGGGGQLTRSFLLPGASEPGSQSSSAPPTPQGGR